MSSAAVTKSDVRMTKCGACPTHFSPPKRGRPAKFCSDACRQRHYVARRKLAEVMGEASPVSPLENEVAEKVATKYAEALTATPGASHQRLASSSLTAAMSGADTEQLRADAEQEIQDGYSEELAAILAAAAVALLAGGFAISVLSTPAVVVPAAVAARDVAGVAVGFAVRAAEATYPGGEFAEDDFADLMQSIRKDVADALMDDMNDAVERALAESEGRSEAARGQAVRDALDPSSPRWQAHAEMIAATSATAAVGAGVAEGARRAQRAGVGIALKWRSRRDSRVRTSHRRADGQVREPGQTFSVGEAQLRYPGDPASPHLGETISCRCVLVPTRAES